MKSPTKKKAPAKKSDVASVKKTAVTTPKTSQKSATKTVKTTPKTSTQKKTPANVSVKSPANKKDIQNFFQKDPLPAQPEKRESNDSQKDGSVFTVVATIFVVVFVVLGGYMYSKQTQLQNQVPPMIEQEPVTPPPSTPELIIDVAKTIPVTPELLSSLIALQNNLYIASDDRLDKASILTDVIKSQSENWELYKHARAGDYVLEFTKRTIIFRPTTKQIIALADVVTKK